MRCINCGIDTRRLRRYEDSSLPSIILTILSQWLLPFEVRNDDNICNPCYILLNSPEARVTRLYGHTMVCIGCGGSLRNSADTHLIENDSPLLPYLSIIQHTLIQGSNYACFTCWVRSRRQQRQDQMRLNEMPSLQIPTTLHEPPLIPVAPLMPPTPQAPRSNRSSNVINLPNYKRASNVSTHCIYRGCANHHLHLVPGFIKQILLNQYNFYVPYYGEHVRANGVYHVEVCPELEGADTGVGGIHPKFLRGRIKSRHISQRIYYTYIVYEGQPTHNNQLDAILGYYCSCLVGNRTVGCCCHVMTIIWYLGWARHQQDSPTPPASFLDTILVRLNE